MTALKQLHQAAQAGETQAREALANAQADVKALREKPVEVAVEVDQDALQEARREAETRMQAKGTKLRKPRKRQRSSGRKRKKSWPQSGSSWRQPGRQNVRP